MINPRSGFDSEKYGDSFPLDNDLTNWTDKEIVSTVLGVSEKEVRKHGMNTEIGFELVKNLAEAFREVHRLKQDNKKLNLQCMEEECK